MCTLIASLLALTVAAPAAAKTYSAERFDVRIRILQGGAMEVVETVVFRFEDGTFDHVFRDLPKRRTDAIEVVSAEMDGRAMSFGTESGQVEIRRESKLRVRWRFAPRSQSTHTFALTYLVHGVVQRQAGHDVLEWTALPAEHDYRIEQSEVVLELPAAPLVRPTIVTKRVTEAALEPGRPAGPGAGAWHRQERVAADAARVRRGRHHRHRAGLAATPDCRPRSRAAMDDGSRHCRWSRPDVPAGAPPAIRQPAGCRGNVGNRRSPAGLPAARRRRRARGQRDGRTGSRRWPRSLHSPIAV